jgi:NAD(P)-dependent dehydrogenase (short-subunit alcohol dehydrogenase family)
MITGASSGIGRALARKVGSAGGTVLLVARRWAQLEEARRDIERGGGTAHVYPCDLSDVVDIDRMAAEVLQQHGHVDVLVNNAGRSIRRPISSSYERFHDFQRTMQLNYFGAVRLILDLLPTMRERQCGHIVNVSTAGVQTSAPMFSAYLASKAALDAFSRSISFEVAAEGVEFSTVYMPLVRTPMVAPTTAFDGWPALTPGQAADMLCTAICKRPARVAKAFSTLGQLGYAIAPNHDRAIGAATSRVMLGRRWRARVAAPIAAESGISGDAAWRETFRHRLERASIPTDPDEVRRLALLLGRLPLFATCSFSELHRLAATAYPIVFQEGDVLCAEGAAASDCYVIVEGEAAVSVRGRDVGTIIANDVVGERGLIENRPRSATVTASRRILAYAISRDRLDQLLRTNSDVAEHMRTLVRGRYATEGVGPATSLAG